MFVYSFYIISLIYDILSYYICLRANSALGKYEQTSPITGQTHNLAPLYSLSTKYTHLHPPISI